MKNFLLVFLLALTFWSCKSMSDRPIADTTLTASLNGTEIHKLTALFKPMLDGVWVKKNYVQSVISTRSPYKSWKEGWAVACMEIALPKDGSDSTYVGYSLNNHEGAEFVLFLKQGHVPTSLKISLPDYEVKDNFYELGYETIKGESNLVLYHYNVKGKIIDKTLYTKVAEHSKIDGDAAWGIDYITNKKLFSGIYKLIGDNGAVDVEFNDAGEVKGFPIASTYNVLTDFMAGPANNLDQLIFDISTPYQKDYTYKFNGDTLNLYSMNTNADSTLLFVDKLKYKLVKKK